MELLAGLIDTDGTRDKTGRYAFTTVSERLASEVATLVRSLGWRAGIVQTAPRLSSSGIQGRQPYYSVSFNTAIPLPVLLERKAFLKAPAKRKIGIAAITRDPQGKVGRCIQVDSEDGLYLAGTHFTPTHNSQMISIYYPAWYLGRHPNHKVIVASHTAELAVDMARKVRNLMQTAEYRQIFPDTTIAADAKAAGKWNTSQGGEYFAIGTGGALAGRGAHLCLAGNTIVRVDDEGEIRLKDVQAGQKIFTVFGWQRITNKILTIHDSWVKINNVDASRDHPFLTTKGWVSAGELRIGDKIKTLTVWNRLWITASSLLRRLRERLGRA